jgi:phosphonate transport system permease protein
MNPAKMPPPPPTMRWRVALWLLGIIILLFASFSSLQMAWGDLLQAQALRTTGEFLQGFAPPDLRPQHWQKIGIASLETLAMSIVGSLLAFVVAVPLAMAASGKFPVEHHSQRLLRWLARLILNFLRAVPEIVWAALLLILAGLGPFAGTLALAAHTSGVLGRLYAELFDNLPPECEQALRHNGVNPTASFLYAGIPLAWPAMLSYLLYRWENNVRAATVLGIVGAGGLGQMLKYHLSLFQMHSAASVLAALLLLVWLVDAASLLLRRRLAR